MTTSQIAATDRRLRPALVATLVAITFIIGIGAGFALSQAVAGRSTVTSAIHVLPVAGNDMSGAAYAAQHAAALSGIPAARNDMSAAAYAAQHATPVTGLSAVRDDMSDAAYGALHAASGTDMSAAAYAATHDR